MANERNEWVVKSLLARADELERFVQAGHYRAGSAAIAIMRILERFFPSAFSYSPLAERQNSAEAASPPPFFVDPRAPVSAPDPVFAETVSKSIREFKAAILRGDQSQALAALRPTRLPETLRAPQQQLEELEAEIDAAQRSKSRSLLLLPRTAKLALWLGETQKAELYASRALGLVNPPQLDPFGDSAQAVHDAHMVLGLLALRTGELERARECLLASSRAVDYLRHSEMSEFRILGPNYSLAFELVARGERSVVLEYLERCRPVWHSPRLDEWIQDMRDGRDPYFDPICLTN
jgi:hypothetical protein